MRYTGLIKRILPFALTFAGGLFIASLFVPIGPSRSFSRHGGDRPNECRKLKMKLQNAEDENLRLQMKLNRYELETGAEFIPEGELPLVPAPPIAPVAPVAPRRHR